MAKIAFSLLPDRFEDKRHESFKTGLRAIGYEVVQQAADKARKNDLVLGWNAYGATYHAMREAAKKGATALVFEEGYIRDIAGEKYFACAMNGHNGYGTWNVGGPDRWGDWNIYLQPWRSHGHHILVCGQRGFGYNEMAMPNNWPVEVCKRLRDLTRRPIYFRGHPKRRAVMPPEGVFDKILDFTEPLDLHLTNAFACVVWTSNSATRALIRGIPVFYTGPAIVTAGASVPLTGDMNEDKLLLAQPPLTDRMLAMIRLSWAQWSVKEFESGVAFDHLLRGREEA
jgi:hypothetical protein